MKTLFATIPIALLPAVFALGGSTQTSVPHAATTVAYVSAQRIFAESTDGKVEVARMQKMQLQKATELRTRQQTLDTLRQQLSKATEGAARAELQQQELQQRTDLEKATMQAQAELQALQRQVQADILSRVKPVIEGLVKGQNVQLVLNADSSVVWAAPGSDLTSAVIERMNSKTMAKQ
jgi:Skp family chaperone for outer membrane proteins